MPKKKIPKEIKTLLADARGARGLRRQEILDAGLGAAGLSPRSVRFEDKKKTGAKSAANTSNKVQKRMYGDEF